MASNIKSPFSKRRLLVLSLDGVPYTFLQRCFTKGLLPYMANLFRDGAFRQMNSVFPPISSVAWSTYMTGKNPGGHKIFGFVDRIPNPLRLYLPTASHLKAKPIWERLSEEGKKVVVINVPFTTPPKPVNGILISGFLAPNIDKGVYPSSFIPKLKQWGYQIDIDVQRARSDRVFLLKDLKRCTMHRFDIATRLMDQEVWDYFHLHIMGTDRINHFLWRRWEDKDPFFAPEFDNYYQYIDNFIGKTLLPILESRKDTDLLILSDHGFCRLKKEVFLNTWLKDIGWFKLKSKHTKSIEDISPDTRAYSLIPGRIYLNLKGREDSGQVDPLKYEATLQELKGELLVLKDPKTGDMIIDSVYMRSEIYKGAYINQAPDMVVLPANGYDLKGNVDQTELAQESVFEGMHTYEDAFLFIKDHEIKKESFSIQDATPTVLRLLGINPYPDLDGFALI